MFITSIMMGDSHDSLGEIHVNWPRFHSTGRHVSLSLFIILHRSRAPDARCCFLLLSPHVRFVMVSYCSPWCVSQFTSLLSHALDELCILPHFSICSKLIVYIYGQPWLTVSIQKSLLRNYF